MMAQSSQFASLVEDSSEEQYQLSHIPEKTTSATTWGMRACRDLDPPHVNLQLKQAARL